MAMGFVYKQQWTLRMSNPMETVSDFESIKTRLRQFVEARDWEQFHSPKNLAMALVGEVGELVEHFQWLTEEESSNLADEKKQAVSEELADVQIYLIMLARKLDIDLLSAVEEKIDQNEAKYPVDKAQGKSLKYTDL